MKKNIAQSVVEYTIVITVVIGALLVMQTYMKRGLQGRWKSSVDELGDMYDPHTTKINLLYNYQTISNSTVTIEERAGKQQTIRYDNTFTKEMKTSNWITPLKDK